MSQRVKQNVARLESPGRIPGIDLARGLAILGMYVAHLTVVTSLEWSRPQTWLGVVEGRSAILFATLAGVSLGLMGSRMRAQAGEHDAARAQRKPIMIRAVLIWTLGLRLLSLDIPVFVVLPAYGLLLMIGAFLVTWSGRALAITAALTAAVAPFVVALIDSGGQPERGSAAELVSDVLGWNYPFVVWLAFVAAGIIAGRVIRRGIGPTVLLLVSGVALSVLGYAVLGPVGNQVIARYGADLPAGSTFWALSVFRDDPHSNGVGGGVRLGRFRSCGPRGVRSRRDDVAALASVAGTGHRVHAFDGIHGAPARLGHLDHGHTGSGFRHPPVAWIPGARSVLADHPGSHGGLYCLDFDLGEGSDGAARSCGINRGGGAQRVG